MRTCTAFWWILLLVNAFGVLHHHRETALLTHPVRGYWSHITFTCLLPFGSQQLTWANIKVTWCEGTELQRWAEEEKILLVQMRKWWLLEITDHHHKHAQSGCHSRTPCCGSVLSLVNELHQSCAPRVEANQPNKHGSLDWGQFSLFERTAPWHYKFSMLANKSATVQAAPQLLQWGSGHPVCPCASGPDYVTNPEGAEVTLCDLTVMLLWHSCVQVYNAAQHNTTQGNITLHVKTGILHDSNIVINMTKTTLNIHQPQKNITSIHE